MFYLKNLYWKRWIRRHGCKLASGLQSLHNGTELLIEQGVRLGHIEISARQVSIGAHSYIRSGCHLSLVSSIGRFCSIGSNVFIGQEKHTHPTHWLSTHPFQYTDSPLTYHAPTSQTVIGHDVWIGHSATIMEGVTVGTGAVIGTGAMVTKDVPPYAIVTGIPAKVVKYRYPQEMAKRLLASAWWEWPIDALHTLPLNDPGACLGVLEAGGSTHPKGYATIRVTRKGGARVETCTRHCDDRHAEGDYAESIIAGGRVVWNGRRRLRFGYLDNLGQAADREMTVTTVIDVGGGQDDLYIQGFCHARRQLRILRVSRITTWTVFDLEKGEYFELPQIFDFRRA